MKEYLVKSIARLDGSKNKSADFQSQGHNALRLKAVVWNPNNLVPGPPESQRQNHYDSAVDMELLKEGTQGNLAIYEDKNLDILEKLTRFRPDSTGSALWTKQQNRFTYTPRQTGTDTFSYPYVWNRS